ncbi:MAG: MFS transporter, partial [Pseudomonadota bacterium]|nr:MFS transporter [Pseudomonadota bacterium]
MKDYAKHEPLPRNLLPWLIWSVGTLFVVFQFLLQLSSGVMVERLMHAFTMTAFDAGLMSGAYYYIYVALQTPAGMLIDRYGARTLLSAGGFVCAMGCFLFAWADHIWVADMGRLLMGGGSAFAYVGMIFLISNWFPARHFGLLLGLSDFVATFATIACNVFLAELLEEISWRASMNGAGVMALVIGFLSFVIIRNRPPTAINAKPRRRMSFLQQASTVMSNPILWLNGIYVGIIFAIVAVFSG